MGFESVARLATLGDIAAFFGGSSALLLGGMVGLGVLLIFVGVQRMIDGRTHSIDRRMETFVYAPSQPLGSPAPGARRQNAGGLGAIFGRRSQRPTPVYIPAEQTGARLTFTEAVARDLARADVKLTVSEFFSICAALAGFGGLLAIALPFGGRFVLAVALIAAGFFLPRYYLTRRKQARQEAFNGHLGDVISLISGALRSGFSFLQAMELVAREGPVPVSTEFDRVVREVGLGVSAEEALQHLVERMESDDLELLVTAVNVQREVGGNLAEILDTIANTIRERVKLAGEVKVLTAQQQFSGYIIGMLPIGLALVLLIINPGYVLGVFRTTVWCGWVMLITSAVMIFAGFTVIRQIVNIKV